MKEFIDFLNTNSGALTILFTAVVTFATVVYAFLTAILVIETRKLRQAQTEPRIEITVDSLDFAVHIVRLCVRNIGEGPARNVKFEVSLLEGGEIGTKLVEEFLVPNFFRTGLRYFGPRQFRYSGYTQTNVNFEAKASSVICFKLCYESATGKKYNDEVVIDMAELRGRRQLGTPNLYSIAKSIEKIQQDFSHTLTGFKRIKIDNFDKQDREAEKSDKDEWMQEMIEKLDEKNEPQD